MVFISAYILHLCGNYSQLLAVTHTAPDSGMVACALLLLIEYCWVDSYLLTNREN